MSQRNNKTNYIEGKKYKRTWLLPLMLLWPGLEGSLAAEEETPEYRLLVRPSICVSYDSEAPCTMSMQVSWEGSDPADVCLRETSVEPLLHCWENSRAGSVQLDYANTVDVLYQLVEESSLGVLAEAEIKVINRDLRSSRKRRRHVWSIL